MNKIHKSWNQLFDNYIFFIDELYDGKTVYPSKEDIFNAFTIPVEDINIVLLGQDCYHNSGTANGYCFSSLGKKIPPSLKNIYKEIQQEFPERNYKFNNGNINIWSDREKILLLNCSLTVEAGKPSSHMNIWKNFTDDVLRYIDKHNKRCVYLLLGNFAKSKKSLIKNKNNIIEGVHPSPLSAHSGFFGSNIFKTVEEKLGKNINWSN